MKEKEKKKKREEAKKQIALELLKDGVFKGS
jgi:hypothetical protein